MLALAARNGRFILVAGLFAGAGLPHLSSVIEPSVPYLVGALLFLNAFRVGDRIWTSISLKPVRSVTLVAVLQLGFPLAAIGILAVTGLPLTGFFFAAVLMMSAPALSGSPNFVVMIGRDPTDAMRLLITGIALFPLTALVVLWILPEIEATEAVIATIRLTVTILTLVFAGAMARWAGRSWKSDEALNLGCDGLSAILLFIVVIGLMSEVGPLVRTSPDVVLLWILLLLALNTGLQLGSFLLFRKIRLTEVVSASVIAGNRNIALFLIALPEETMQQAMLFIGCYQIPMYLTPLIMKRIYR